MLPIKFAFDVSFLQKKNFLEKVIFEETSQVTFYIQEAFENTCFKKPLKIRQNLQWRFNSL